MRPEDDLSMAPDVLMSMSLGNAGSNADSIRMVDCHEAVIDTVIYGDSFNGTDPWVDDQGNLPDFLRPSLAQVRALVVFRTVLIQMYDR